MKKIVFVLVLVPFLFGASSNITLKPGTYTFGPINANQFNKYTKFAIDRTLWTDPAVKIEATLQYSTDGGTTWNFLCSFKAEGGSVDRGSQYTSISCPLPPDANRVQGTGTVTGGNLVLTENPTLS